MEVIELKLFKDDEEINDSAITEKKTKFFFPYGRLINKAKIAGN